jgi:hypothetical protein
MKNIQLYKIHSTGAYVFKPNIQLYKTHSTGAHVFKPASKQQTTLKRNSKAGKATNI